MIKRGVWPALVLALFCLPLFVDLGQRDLQNDEAIYSFTVDRILETGDWLDLRASPHENGVPFLEKPPLMFWIVAAPIKLGIVPHNEFGLRFGSALFASVAFLYVFFIGVRLFNPLTGALAVLILFAHGPLLFEHGLRDNVMDGPLFLCYCGGIYHYLAWYASESSGSRWRRWGHPIAVGLYFTLGFMTKFVAAIFLPLVLAVCTLGLRETRARLARDWAPWLASKGVCLAAIAPWFVYANHRYGASYWNAIFSEHVLQRFTSYLDPGHVQPWHFYLTSLVGRWSSSGTFVLAAAGLILLAYHSITRRWVEGTVLVVWFALPVLLISGGSSKLYYYLDPFFPPLALAAGYLLAMAFALAPAPFDRAVTSLYGWAKSRVPRAVALCRTPPVRVALWAAVAVSLGLIVLAVAKGPVAVALGNGVLLRSNSVFRPAMAALVFALPLGLSRRARSVIAPLLVASLIPWPAYRASLVELTNGPHPYRSASACIRQVGESMAGPSRGLYLQWSSPWIWHPVYYYFRHIQPWTRTTLPSPENMDRFLHDPAAQRPIILAKTDGQPFLDAPHADPAVLDLEHDLVLLMPGPYAACGQRN